MERTAIAKLIKWNENKRRKPLIVWGARQVGKTYLIKEIFAETFYKNNYIYIDFKKEDEINEFCSKTANTDKIIEYISLFKGKGSRVPEYRFCSKVFLPGSSRDSRYCYGFYGSYQNTARDK